MPHAPPGTTRHHLFSRLHIFMIHSAKNIQKIHLKVVPQLQNLFSKLFEDVVSVPSNMKSVQISLVEMSMDSRKLLNFSSLAHASWGRQPLQRNNSTKVKYIHTAQKNAKNLYTSYPHSTCKKKTSLDDH